MRGGERGVRRCGLGPKKAAMSASCEDILDVLLAGGYKMLEAPRRSILFYNKNMEE